MRLAKYTHEMDLLLLAAAIPALLALFFLIFAIVAFSRGRRVGGVVQVLVAAIFLSVAALLGLISLAVNGYRAFTSERTAATVEIIQEGDQLFSAQFTFPEGERKSFRLSGDELYVDARILKWHPRATLLGLNTAYQLDRVAGRYRSLDDERTSARTVYSLAREGPVDMFAMARRYPWLSALVDAEYGSATFMSIEDGASYELRVSNSGLLIREVAVP